MPKPPSARATPTRIYTGLTHRPGQTERRGKHRQPAHINNTGPDKPSGAENSDSGYEEVF